MMNKTEKLNKVFSNKLMRSFIPIVNPIITFINNGSRVMTRYDHSQKGWVHMENGTVLSIDKNPCWNISYKTIEKAVRTICCKNYLPKTGDIVVDLGAGVGFETVLFQRLVGETGKVFAVEAHPKTAFFLELLCEKNGYKNVTVSQVAIGGINGFVYIENRNNHVANSIKENANTGLQVPIMTFDYFVEQKQISSINFLKINIEGAEVDMIEGMTKSIGIVKNLAVSCHDFLDPVPGDRIRKIMIGFLEANRFNVEESQDTHPVRRSWLFAKKN